eukprot:g48812.t1
MGGGIRGLDALKSQFAEEPENNVRCPHNHQDCPNATKQLPTSRVALECKVCNLNQKY